MKTLYALKIRVAVVIVFLFLLSGEISAQTASQRPLSSVITLRIKEKLDSKPQDKTNPADQTTMQSRLPSGRELPRQAIEAKKMNNNHAMHASGNPAELPSHTRIDVNKVIERNMKFLSQSEGKKE